MTKIWIFIFASISVIILHKTEVGADSRLTDLSKFEKQDTIPLLSALYVKFWASKHTILFEQEIWLSLKKYDNILTKLLFFVKELKEFAKSLPANDMIDDETHAIVQENFKEIDAFLIIEKEKDYSEDKKYLRKEPPSPAGLTVRQQTALYDLHLYFLNVLFGKSMTKEQYEAKEKVEIYYDLRILTEKLENYGKLTGRNKLRDTGFDHDWVKHFISIEEESIEKRMSETLLIIEILKFIMDSDQYVKFELETTQDGQLKILQRWPHNNFQFVPKAVPILAISQTGLKYTQPSEGLQKPPDEKQEEVLFEQP
ncbi:hypothetical protein PGB90_004342 [Kerria lacca]